MRWSARGTERLLESARRAFEGASWPSPPPGFHRLGPLREMRQVLRGRLREADDVEVVAKWSRPVRRADHVSRRLRGGKGVREGRMLRSLAARGLSVPRALAFTDEGVDLLLTEPLEGLESLPAAGALDHETLRSVAALLGRAWAAGLRHGDLHRDNVMLRSGSPLLVDLGGARLASPRNAARALGRAASGMAAGLSRTQRLRAVVAWLTAAGESPSRARLHRVARDAGRHEQRVTRRYRRGRDRRATRSGRHYVVFASAKGRGIRRRDTPPAWEHDAPTWTAGPLPEATPLKAGGRVVETHLPPHAPRVVAKRYATTAPGRRPRALRAFRRAAALRNRGVAAPRPLLAFTDTDGRGVLVSERVEGLDLHRWTDGGRGGAHGALPSAGRRELADRLGRALRCMHDAEISHRDLKAPNLVLAGVPTGPHFYVVDVDGARRCRPSWRRRARDLARLDASLDAPATTRARVLRAYWDAGARPPVTRRRFASWIASDVAQKRGPSGRPR